MPTKPEDIEVSTVTNGAVATAVEVPQEEPDAPEAPEPGDAPAGAEDAPEEPETDESPDGGSEDEEDTTEGPDDGPDEETAAAAEPQEVADLPAWAQKVIRDAREEAARTRVEAKKTAAEEAAKAAQDDLVQKIGTALGIIQPEAEGEEGDSEQPEPLDPEKLVQQLEQEREHSQSAVMELAVYKAAGAADADPNALLDSRQFMAALKGVDPTDAEAVTKAIAAAVDANPRFRIEQPAPAAEPEPQPATPSGGTFAGGPSGRSNDATSMSVEDFRKTFRDTRPR